MTMRYALHPGYVTSRHDFDVHYIGVMELARLYNVDPLECIVWDQNTARSRDYNDYIHLYPRSDGDYKTPLLEHLKGE